MAGCISPHSHNLNLLPRLCSSGKEAQGVSKHIRGEVVDLVVGMADRVEA